MLKLVLCLVVFVGIALIVACGPVTYNLSSVGNQGLTESLAIKIEDGSEVTVRPGQRIYIYVQNGFRKADGRSVNTCRGLQIDSSQSNMDSISLDVSDKNIVLDMQSSTVRLFREGGYLLCDGRTILTVKTRGGVKPGSYPVVALLKIDDNGEKGEQELSFTVVVPEDSP